MFFDQLLNTVNLFTIKSSVILKPNWGKPKLCLILIAFNMYVGWQLLKKS